MSESKLDLSEVRDDLPDVPVDPKALCHKITVYYDPDQQCVKFLEFQNASDPKPEFKSWPLVQAVLRMAFKLAERMEEMSIQQAAAAQMQQQMVQQQMAMQQAQQLGRRNGRR